MQNIRDSAGASPAQRKFVVRETILEAGYIIKCQINVEKSRSDIVSFTAVCLQTSQLRKKPHEFNGELPKDGKIEKNSYSVLLFCSFLYCFFQIYLHVLVLRVQQ